ncbi:MAG: sigma-70 family RNA polymerase sigma factor [Patescibacteria group bacterium]
MENAPAVAATDSNRSERAVPRARAVAFEEVYAEHRLAVYRYLRGWGACDEVAADLTAETFERAYRNRAKYQPGEGGPRTWLFRIARNLAIDTARRRESAQRGLRFWPRAEMAPDPAELVLRKESDRVLAHRVAALPAAQREAIVLRFTGGLAAREIGLVLGRSEAASHKLISRALAKLREEYRDDE